jgi:hypothetical protein
MRTPSQKKGYIFTNNTSSIHIPLPTLRPLPQHILLDLPRARLGQLIHNLHLAGNHEFADTRMFLAVLDDIFAG